jgi:hypothetical protein
MRVFVSWSKEPSKTVAEALRNWLPDVIQNIEPFMSAADISAGARWSPEIAQQLTDTKVGIICVTPQNQGETWLNFEAGALSKTVSETFVCPYLIGISKADLVGPMTQFQAKTANKAETWELMKTLNSALPLDSQLTDDRLHRQFDRAWPELEQKLSSLPAPQVQEHRSVTEMLAEVLGHVRSIRYQEPATEAEREANEGIFPS